MTHSVGAAPTARPLSVRDTTSITLPRLPEAARTRHAIFNLPAHRAIPARPPQIRFCSLSPWASSCEGDQDDVILASDMRQDGFSFWSDIPLHHFYRMPMAQAVIASDPATATTNVAHIPNTVTRRFQSLRRGQGVRSVLF